MKAVSNYRKSMITLILILLLWLAFLILEPLFSRLRKSTDFSSYYWKNGIIFISVQVFKQNLNPVTRRVLVEMHLCAMWLVNYERDTTIEIRIAAAIKEKKNLLCFLPCLRRSFIYRWSHLQTFLIQVF